MNIKMVKSVLTIYTQTQLCLQTKKEKTCRSCCSHRSNKVCCQLSHLVLGLAPPSASGSAPPPSAATAPTSPTPSLGQAIDGVVLLHERFEHRITEAAASVLLFAVWQGVLSRLGIQREKVSKQGAQCPQKWREREKVNMVLNVHRNGQRERK